MTLTTPAAPSATAKGADATLDADAKNHLDAIIARLAAGETGFRRDEPSRIARKLVDRVHASVADAATEWVEAATRIKRLNADSPYVGEEWISGPYAGTGIPCRAERSAHGAQRRQEPHSTTAGSARRRATA